jgi:hypothetical protein
VAACPVAGDSRNGVPPVLAMALLMLSCTAVCLQDRWATDSPSPLGWVIHHRFFHQ